MEDCLGQFIDRDALALRAVQIRAFVDTFEQQHIIPSMYFTTDGLLHALLFAASIVDLSDSDYPELQIWRRMDETDTYNRVYSTSSTAVPALTRYLNVYQYIVDPPFSIQSGDVLGIYQPQMGPSRFALAYVEERGHINYIFAGERLESLNLSNTDESPFLSPLVTVEFGKQCDVCLFL